MESFLIYLVQVNLILLASYLFYKVALRNARHHLDRIYLLGAAIAAFAFPAIQVSLGSLSPAENDSVFFLQNIPAILSGGSSGIVNGSTLLWYEWLYLIPAAALILLSLWSLGRILTRALRTPKIRKDGYTLVVGAGVGPASFGRFLFWEGDINIKKAEDRMVLAHELGHIRQGHTYDLLLFEVIRALCWFNPVVHLLYKELKQTHEFLADAEVLQNAQPEELSKLIVSQALGVSTFSLANHFSSHTKKRISMLRKSNRNGSWYRYLLALPMLALVFCSTSVAQNKTKVKTDSNGEVMNQVMPKPLNMGEVQKMIGYPKEADKKGIEGKVVVGIIVGKKGEVLEAKVVSSPSVILTKAVADHIEKLKFSPGTRDGVPFKTKLTIPFNFKLKKDHE